MNRNLVLGLPIWNPAGYIRDKCHNLLINAFVKDKLEPALVNWIEFWKHYLALLLSVKKITRIRTHDHFYRVDPEWDWIALWLLSAKNSRGGELLLFQGFFKFFTSFYFYFCAQWWKNWPHLKVCITWCWVQHFKFCSWVDSMNLRKFVRMAKWRLIVFLIELELDHFIIFRKLLPGD